MKIYNKLVRDNIPQIISQNRQKAHISTLDSDQYNIALRKKLCEEVQEYLDSEDIEELADIMEVVEALTVFRGSTLDEVLKVKEKKAAKNGKFEKRLFLEKVED